MPTVLSFLSGRQITNDSGVPQAGAKLHHYRAGTTTALTVWQDEAGTVPHAQPVVADAGGFAPLIYVDDSFDWKVVVTTAADVTLKTYDELPAAPADAADVGFAPPLLAWTQVTSASSPVALTAADVGKAYEADTTSGSVEFDLPSAATVGNGKGFVFKKVAAANSLIIDPNGSETIDDSSTSLTITAVNVVIGIFSNGAEWYKAFEIAAPITLPTVQRFTTGSGTYTPPAGVRQIRVRMVGGGGGGGASATNGGANGTTTSFATWTAVNGNGGAAGGTGTGGAGGTGGVDGTGTLIARFAGANGGVASTAGDFAMPSFGGSSFFGGAGPTSGAAASSSAGAAAKANTGGGGGGGINAAGNGGGGGGAGEYVEFFVSAPSAVSYTVGGGGNGGAAGGNAGGNGAAGVIIVEEFY